MMSQYFGIPGYPTVASNHGRGEEFWNGRKDGFEKGRNEGWEDGRKTGWDQGWEEAVGLANIEISKANNEIREHIADKEAMAQQLQEQHRLIGMMSTRLNELERENANLKQANPLRHVVTALKEANERLQTEVAQLDKKYQERSKEYADQVYKYNHNMVFMNAVRGTLEELTENNDAQAKQVRQIFQGKYKSEVANALQRKEIRVAPDCDESFAISLPRTRRFIVKMLDNVAPEIRKKLQAEPGYVDAFAF